MGCFCSSSNVALCYILCSLASCRGVVNKQAYQCKGEPILRLKCVNNIIVIAFSIR